MLLFYIFVMLMFILPVWLQNLPAIINVHANIDVQGKIIFSTLLNTVFDQISVHCT